MHKKGCDCSRAAHLRLTAGQLSPWLFHTFCVVREGGALWVGTTMWYNLADVWMVRPGLTVRLSSEQFLGDLTQCACSLSFLSMTSTPPAASGWVVLPRSLRLSIIPPTDVGVARCLRTEWALSWAQAGSIHQATCQYTKFARV
jgi:hypothetical protein